MSSDSKGETEVCCRTCGAPTTIQPAESGAFAFVCDACGESGEGRYRAEDGTIVWR